MLRPFTPPPHPGAAPLNASTFALHRGVIYLPETEQISHYFYASMPRQFDAVLHFDETRAVEPLERATAWEKGEAPETFPFGR
jgi:hypothetical protein